MRQRRQPFVLDKYPPYGYHDLPVFTVFTCRILNFDFSFGFYDVPKNNINASPVTYGPHNKLILEKWKQCGLHIGVLQVMFESVVYSI